MAPKVTVIHGGGVSARITDEFSPKAANVGARDVMRLQAMNFILAILQGTVVPLTPVGVTSILRGSWQSDPPRLTGDAVTGVLGSTLLYSEVIERGRQPGAPPPPSDALQTWVDRKLGEGVSAYVIARSIGRKGIRGRLMLQTAITTTEAARRGVWDALTSTMLERS